MAFSVMKEVPFSLVHITMATYTEDLTWGRLDEIQKLQRPYKKTLFGKFLQTSEDEGPKSLSDLKSIRKKLRNNFRPVFSCKLQKIKELLQQFYFSLNSFPVFKLSNLYY